jgi:putative hydrolase of the HAD superfamily
MIGNSPKSDILPVVAIGGTAVYIPAATTWAHELVQATPEANGYYQLQNIRQLSRFLAQM